MHIVQICCRKVRNIRLLKSCFFFAADAKYFPYGVLAARRVLDISAPMQGFILQIGVSDSDLQVANRILDGQVTIVDVSNFLAGLVLNPGHLSLAIYIRLFADRLREFEPYDRVVYADSDVLFNRSVADLANSELRAPLLAAHDEQSYFNPRYRKRLSMQPGAPRFNSGILMFDMAQVRHQGLLDRARQVALENDGLDQDALNVAFEGKWQTMHPFWNVMTNYSSQIPFDRAYARHFSWGKPWDRRPIGVEVDALAIYRDLSKGTPWADRFNQGLPIKRGALKSLGRKFDAISGFLINDEKRKRRSRYDAERASAIFALHAEQGLMAVSFSEVIAGFAKKGCVLDLGAATCDMKRPQGVCPSIVPALCDHRSGAGARADEVSSGIPRIRGPIALTSGLISAKQGGRTAWRLLGHCEPNLACAARNPCRSSRQSAAGPMGSIRE
ncbi:glycosyltransferase [Mesorhizobium sp. STM 4661]|uniref:glycosyltransferase family 8 protein n=1 Tax=Mesorhizobium sp. STM 4661 TaxID=1297570 RepID=UPI0005624B95|nr:glycosyltransferase [Mesorhizobium sp. STM 4661]